MGMVVPEEGAVIRIESYKHDGRLHRAWKKSVVLKKGEPLIIANYNVEVVEADGREWVFPGLTVGSFHRSAWFHTLVVYGEEGNHRFYTHIASPYRYRDGVLSYIDYDLDLVAEADRMGLWVDQEEFDQNRIRYSYPDEVIQKVEEAVGRVGSLIRSREEPFTSEWVDRWYHRFQSYKSRLME
jgi:protein associated with RNAse G/E